VDLSTAMLWLRQKSSPVSGKPQVRRSTSREAGVEFYTRPGAEHPIRNVGGGVRKRSCGTKFGWNNRGYREENCET